MVSNAFYFLFCLILSVPEKFKNSIFEMPKFSQTLNINSQRITGARSINLHVIRKLIEYFFKNDFCRDNVYSYLF